MPVTALKKSGHREFYFALYHYSYLLSMVLIGFSASRFALFHAVVFLGFTIVFKRMMETYS